MEKQPIDDLFARKLREAELFPRADTFNRLQSRISAKSLPTTRKRKALGWYSAAASLVLIAFFLYRGFSSKLTAAQEVAQKNQGKAGVVKSPVNSPNTAVALTQMRQGQSHEQYTPKPSMAVNTKKAPRSMIASSPQIAVGSIPSRRVSSLDKETPTATTEAVINVMPIAQNQGTLKETGVTAPPLSASDQLTKNLQRVVVMTIEEPVVVQPVVALQTAQPPLEKQPQTATLSGLFSKIKQLKNGDLMARATPAKQPTESRTRLGRVFDGVKESLKNETTVD